MGVKHKSLQIAKPKLPEMRCSQCNRLLFLGIVEDVEVKCPRCGAIQHLGLTRSKAGLVIHSC